MPIAVHLFVTLDPATGQPDTRPWRLILRLRSQDNASPSWPAQAPAPPARSSPPASSPMTKTRLLSCEKARRFGR
ncbi:MAG TPA: hypothetical protein DIT64_17780 [Verrucomicrobiales bacterium]|nr:hypothetical protein [Verrucomicrobiales bacterium]